MSGASLARRRIEQHDGGPHSRATCCTRWRRLQPVLAASPPWIEEAVALGRPTTGWLAALVSRMEFGGDRRGDRLTAEERWLRLRARLAGL